MSPPPASAFSGMAWATQLHQPTGAAVARSPPEPEQHGDRDHPATPRDQHQGDHGHQKENDDQCSVEAAFEEHADQHRADETRHPDHEQDEGEYADVNLCHRFKKRAKVGEKSELAHEEGTAGCHSQNNGSALKQL